MLTWIFENLDVASGRVDRGYKFLNFDLAHTQPYNRLVHFWNTCIFISATLLICAKKKVKGAILRPVAQKRRQRSRNLPASIYPTAGNIQVLKDSG